MSVASPSLIVRDSGQLEFLSHGESFGVLFDFLSGTISTLAAIYVLCLISRRLHKEGWSNWDALHVSVAALFLAECILGVGHAMSLKWAIKQKVYPGGFCTAQGVMRQMGGTAVALATLTIAVQTFLSLYWLVYLNRTISAIAIGVEYLFVILFVAIGFAAHTHPPREYYAVPTPFWCWIGHGFEGERLGGQYAWFWVALLVSIVLYIPLFLMHFGIIKPGDSWYLPNNPTQSNPSNGSPRALNTTLETCPTDQPTGARDPSPVQPDGSSSLEVQPRRNNMLWSTILYPVLYCVLVLPLSIVRWIAFGKDDTTKGTHHLAGATLTVVSIFALSGIANAVLYLTTRRRFFHPNNTQDDLPLDLPDAATPTGMREGEKG